MAWVAVGGALVSVVGGAVSANQGRKAAARARDAQRSARLKMEAILRRRTPVTNPYANSKNLSSLAEDLTSQLSNPFNSLGVATQAAEIQMEQSDLALANTLDTLRATGSSAGGATALAQAALQSKKGVSANIEQQEAQNEKLRAQGEQQLNQQKMAELQRQQGIALSEGQRMQQNDAAGEQFMFQANEQRINMDLNRAAGQETQASQNLIDANTATAAGWGSVLSAVGNIAVAKIGTTGKFNTVGGVKKTYKDWAGSQNLLSGADISREAYRAYKKN
jgi:hypothetical protein|tara:strand:- start:51 stop:884 length:834 start_codon:yes stop_codon:yes gene_type:complete